ncbi:unnamed protein product [Ranitomeya imitator]|uniref:Reverse transcriptase domain-containing protein n=1 Tax=Ranitomeya imitator TaxID=111125 RepID=A0ABN9LV94_9NEOB|nr:unnamed protein product [Ranitomeya imitator]
MVHFELDIPSVIHYLEDFLFIGSGKDNTWAHLLHVFRRLMNKIGVPIGSEKTEDKKLVRLASVIDQIVMARKARLKQVQSLLGLSLLAMFFSRRLSLATRGVERPNHFVRIFKSIKEDLLVWKTFLHSFDGNVICQEDEVSNFDLQLVTDTSGCCGFGAVFGSQWCRADWPPAWHDFLNECYCHDTAVE